MHDENSYTTLIGILVHAKKFEVINMLLNDMQRDKYEPAIVTYNFHIHCYGHDNYMTIYCTYMTIILIWL